MINGCGGVSLPLSPPFFTAPTSKNSSLFSMYQKLYETFYLKNFI